jgi:hypothetical protein
MFLPVRFVVALLRTIFIMFSHVKLFGILDAAKSYWETFRKCANPLGVKWHQKLARDCILPTALSKFLSK